jgi:hypothetical protein
VRALNGAPAISLTALCSWHSALGTLLSALCSLLSAFCTPLLTLGSWLSALGSLHSALGSWAGCSWLSARGSLHLCATEKVYRTLLMASSLPRFAVLDFVAGGRARIPLNESHSNMFWRPDTISQSNMGDFEDFNISDKATLPCITGADVQGVYSCIGFYVTRGDATASGKHFLVAIPSRSGVTLHLLRYCSDNNPVSDTIRRKLLPGDQSLLQHTPPGGASNDTESSISTTFSKPANKDVLIFTRQDSSFNVRPSAIWNEMMGAEQEIRIRTNLSQVQAQKKTRKDNKRPQEQARDRSGLDIGEKRGCKKQRQQGATEFPVQHSTQVKDKRRQVNIRFLRVCCCVSACCVSP